MKKIICMVLMLSILMSTVNIAFPIKSYAENESSEIELYSTDNIINITSVDEIQSEHPYSSNTDITYVYTHQSDADSLNITFSDDTEVESNYDFIYIYDGYGIEMGKYTGTELAGQTVEVSGNVAKIRLTSDSSVNRNGFTVTSIDAVLSTGPITNLRYTSRTKDSVTLSFPTPKEATSVTVEQSVDGKEWITSTTTELLGTSSTIANVIGLEMETQYYFRLNVVGGRREGLSNEISVTTYGLYTPEESFEFCDGVIMAYLGEDTEVFIPNKIDGIAVTSIGSYAFYDCTSMVSISIPKSVTSIGSNAFYNCSNLVNVEIPENVISIGDAAFSYCSSLESIIMGNSLESIPDSMFEYCSSLTNITMSNSVLTIGSNAFYNCNSLINIEIPESVTSIGSYAFYECNSMTSITIPKSVTSIGSHAFYNCCSLVNAEISESVMSIGDCAFYGCSNLEKLYWNAKCVNDFGVNVFSMVGELGKGIDVVFGDSVESIPNDAFSGCSNLARVEIGNNVTHIGSYTFYDCDLLENITVPDSVTNIGSYAFLSCNGLTSVKLGDGVKNIATGVFSSCENLTSFIVDESNKYYASVEGNLFSEDKTVLIQYAVGKTDSEYSIPNGVTTIGSYAFEKCSSLEHIIIPESVTNIGNSSFYYCNGLISVTIPDSVTIIEDYAFRHCDSLKSVIIGNGVGKIDYDTFADCSNLISVTIPKSVTSINSYAFDDCIALTDVYYYGSIEDWNKISIGSYNTYLTSATIHYSEEIETYTIAYDANGGSVAPEPQTKNEGESIFLSSVVPTREGYTFLGWATTSDAIEAEYDSGATFEVDADTTLYAVWQINKLNTHTITYDANGGNGAPEPQTKNEGESIFLSSVVPTREGYTFLGWATISDATEVEYNSGATFEVDADTTLYAVWEPNNSENEDNNIVASGECGENLIWTLDDEGTLVISGIGDMSDSPFILASPWYSWRESINKVIIEEGVTSIRTEAFRDCDNLISVTIPDSVNNIGRYAFFGCKQLVDITIPKGITSISEGTFENCTSLHSVTIPESVTYIGDSAFYECTSLYSVTIPESVTHIGDYAFMNCDSSRFISMTDNKVSIGHAAFDNCSGINFENIEITDIGEYAFYNAGGGINATFSETVEEIKDRAFGRYVGAGKITIPKTITVIKNGAFWECLADIEIQSETLAVGRMSFENAFVTIPKDLYLTKIDEHSFYSCSGSFNIIIGEDITYIPSETFEYSGLTSITIKGDVTNIEDETFHACSSLTSVKIQGTTKSIGENAFDHCTNLTDLSLGESIIEINDYAFYFCEKLNDFDIPKQLNSIGNYSFAACYSLNEVIIPDSVTKIGIDAFVSCSGLEKVIIGNSVTDIGNYAFSSCSALKEVTLGKNIITIGRGAFYGSTMLERIYWNAENVTEFYSGSDGYEFVFEKAGQDSTGIEVIFGDDVKNIPDCTFYECSGLINVTMGSALTEIGESAFLGCSGLMNVTMGNALTEIGEFAFSDCHSLINITIPKTVVHIGSYAFSGCENIENVYINDIKSWCNINFDGEFSNPMHYGYGANLYLNNKLLENLYIPDSVENIGMQFKNCKSIKNIVIPNSVTKIEKHAFGGCDNLESITLPFIGTSRDVTEGGAGILGCMFDVSYDERYGWTEQYYSEGNSAYYSIPSSLKKVVIRDAQCIPYRAFYNCINLTEITIPNTVNNINERSFYNCDGLTRITIPDSVTSIGAGAFSNCDSLTSVTIGDSVTSIEYGAFRDCSSLTDVYYAGSEEEWNNIYIESYNWCLTGATIHYDVPILDAEPLPQEGEITKSIGIFKSYHEDDNRVWIDELGDFSLVSTRYVTDETDIEFLNDLESIIDEYVLVEENVYWEHGTYYGDILSVKPVKSIIGKLLSVTGNTVVLDSKSYTIDKEFLQTAKLSLNKYVMIHILDDKIVGITQLYNKKGILTEYKESEGILVIDGGEYSISSAADMSSLSNINNMIGKKIGFYLDDEWDWNIVRIASHETVTGNVTFYLKSQNEVSVGDKTYCVNTDEYTFDEELLGKRVFCLVEDDFIIHMDSIYKLMPRLLISISSSELSYNNGFENSSFSVNAELRNGWNYDLPQMYDEDVILEDEFFKTLPTTNITLGDMTWNANENVEYALSGSNCGGVVIPFKGSHQMTLEGKIKDGYVPPEYKINLTSEFCVQAQEPRMTRTLTDTHNLRITNLGKKPLAAENFVSNNTPLQNVYLYANQLNENLNDYLEEIKNTPDKVMSSEEQLETIARRLMEEDDNSSSKRINGLDGIIGMPEDDRVYAYMALAQYLEGYVNEGKDLGKIDVSADVISVATSIVSAVRSNMDWTQFSCEYGGYAIDINMLNVYGAGYGTITLQKGNSKPYTGAIISTNAEIASAMESYLNQVKELGLNATNEILYSYAGELAKLTGFADIEKSAIKKVVDRKLNKVFKDSGYGDVASILKNCYDCFDQIRDVLKCTTPDDLVGTLSDTEDLIKKLEKLDFEKYDISEGVTSKIVDKINDSRKALVAALNDYLIDEGTDSNGNFFDSFIKHIIECPIDFTVYDESNNEIGYVRNGLIYCDDSIHIETKGDVKYVYIPKDKDYKIELEATDDGEFTYVIEDVNNGNVSGRLNFYSIPITAGNTFIPEIQTNALTGNKNEVYLNSNNGIIKADEYISGDSEKVLVEIGYVGNGTVVGGGAYTKGDSVTLSATANEGYSFKGWYNEDGVVSNESIYRFPAFSDVEIYAKFERANIVDSRFTINIDEDYADKMYVKAYKNDGITNNISVNMFDFSNISAELDLKCVLYDNDKVIDEIIQEAKFDKSCGGYVIDSVDLSQCDIMEIYDSSNNLIATLVNNDTGEIRALDSLENSLIVNADYVGVDLDVYNQSASQQTLRAYLGIYDNDHRLIDLLSSDSIILEPNTSNNLNIDKEIDIKNADSTYHIKLFIWEKGNSLKPLSKVQEVLVNE